MKTLSIAIFVVSGSLTLTHGQPGAGKPYNSRDPFSCKSKKEPARGAPSGNLLKEYVRCANEKIAGGYIGLFENLQVDIGKSRPYSSWSDSGNTDIDVSQPVYPIRGAYDGYLCRPPGSMGFPAGGNCNLRKASPFTGVCYKTTFGDWSCPVQGTGDPLANVQTNIPPPK